MAAIRGKKGESSSSKMREEEEEEDGEDNILYDLLVNTEWPPEIEVQVSLRRGRTGMTRLLAARALELPPRRRGEVGS